MHNLGILGVCPMMGFDAEASGAAFSYHHCFQANDAGGDRSSTKCANTHFLPGDCPLSAVLKS